MWRKEARSLIVALMFVPMDPLRETSCVPWGISLCIFSRSGFLLASEGRLEGTQLNFDTVVYPGESVPAYFEQVKRALQATQCNFILYGLFNFRVPPTTL